MDYKMIVLDMDDTLLRDDHSISTRTKEAIEKAQKQGVKVVLASGRPDYAMKETAKDLGLDEHGSYIVSYNGAIIIDCKTDEIIFERSLSKEIAHELYDFSKEHNVHLHTYWNDDIITEKNNEYTEIEANITGMEIKTIDDFKKAVKGNVIKVLMLEDPEYLKKVELKLKPQLKDKLNMTISKPFFLEFMDKGIDKGASLSRLIDRLGIKQEEVIAMGDSYNDLSMLKFAGLGVAMANSPDDIKSEVEYITDSNMEDGVAKVIEKFVLEKN